jgi:soluble cytochrome b562
LQRYAAGPARAEGRHDPRLKRIARTGVLLKIRTPSNMKILSASLLLLALPVLSPAALADDAPAAPTPPASAPAAAAPAPDEKKTELEMRMGRMGKAFKKLRKQVADPAQNASSLELLTTMDGAANEALELTPAKAQDLPEDQRAKFEEDFKAGIRGMLDQFAKLRDALTAGRNDDAVKIVADIVDLEKKDHKEFRRPDKD